jgi:hypothetical protein
MTWNEIESGLLANADSGFTKIGDGQYVITATVAEGQSLPVLLNRSGNNDAWADFIAIVGNVPDEKLNELLWAAPAYICGALIKVGTECVVRHSYSIEHFFVETFIAAIQQTAIAAAGLKNQFCPE